MVLERLAGRPMLTSLAGQVRLNFFMAAKQEIAKSAAPAVRTTLTTSVFEQLISYVIHNKWNAGERVPPERELCQQLGIARTSLREVLKAMELIGMLESRTGDGTFVCSRTEFLSRPLLWALTGTDHAELHDIMEARLLLELNLAGLAAERARREDLEKIEATLHAMKERIATGDSIVDCDIDFHLAIAEAAHNEILSNAVQLLRNLLRQWISLTYLSKEARLKVLRAHKEIYSAIEARDGEKARKALQEHLKTHRKPAQQGSQR